MSYHCEAANSRHGQLNMQLIGQPARSDRLGEYLKRNLSSAWTQLRIAVAFVKRSGTRHVIRDISSFARTAKVEIIVGIDHQGTSVEGLQDLLDAVGDEGRVIVFHNRLPFTFHPKVYLFKDEKQAEVAIGSGNLTQGGLYTNYEMSVLHTLSLDQPDHRKFLKSIEDMLDEWADTISGNSAVLNQTLIEALVDDGLIVKESAMHSTQKPAAQQSSDNGAIKKSDHPTALVSPFVAKPVPPSPQSEIPMPVLAAIGQPTGRSRDSHEQMFTLHSGAPKRMHFVMTLQKTDVGTGQTTQGTAKRSPEIFVPLSARDALPDFWGWPLAFREDPDREGKYDRTGVRVRLGTKVFQVNMMTWPVKRDFRLRAEALRSAGNIGDILHLEKMKETSSFDYYAEVIPPGTSQFEDYRAICNQKVKNSNKTFGYF